MLNKPMPLGIPVQSMTYFPNQKELQLVWFSQKRGTVTRTTYGNVPIEVGNHLFNLTDGKDIMSYVKGTILAKPDGKRTYPVVGRKTA